METDPDLQRFLDAQAPVYQAVLAELERGRKRSHWMWFIFPQLAGLGRSSTALHYAMRNREHAAGYLAHPLLGARLRHCVGLVNRQDALTAEQIFGYPDYLKFHLTLFHEVSSAVREFSQALEKYYGGKPDEATIRLLQTATPSPPGSTSGNPDT